MALHQVWASLYREAIQRTVPEPVIGTDLGGPIIGHGVCVVGSMVDGIGTVEGVESSAGMFGLIGTDSDSRG